MMEENPDDVWAPVGAKTYVWQPMPTPRTRLGRLRRRGWVLWKRLGYWWEARGHR